MILLMLRWILVLVIAHFAGRLITKLKMPAILGWLIAGMMLGPHAAGLLPHSGVSLVFTGIVCGVLEGTRPDLAQIVKGTIAAAAVINEIIAVIAAKKGFELAGEIPGSPKPVNKSVKQA